MKRIAIWALALTLTLGLFTPGVAQAHQKTFNTRLKMGVSKTLVTKGQPVVFRGTLKAKNRKCFRNKTVRITRNGNRFASGTTNNRGRYRIVKAVKKGGRYQASYGGFQFGVHPHNHICSGSVSSRIRIRLK